MGDDECRKVLVAEVHTRGVKLRACPRSSLLQLVLDMLRWIGWSGRPPLDPQGQQEKENTSIERVIYGGWVDGWIDGWMAIDGWMGEWWLDR